MKITMTTKHAHAQEVSSSFRKSPNHYSQQGTEDLFKSLSNRRTSDPFSLDPFEERPSDSAKTSLTHSVVSSHQTVHDDNGGRAHVMSTVEFLAPVRKRRNKIAPTTIAKPQSLMSRNGGSFSTTEVTMNERRKKKKQLVKPTKSSSSTFSSSSTVVHRNIALLDLDDSSLCEEELDEERLSVEELKLMHHLTRRPISNTLRQSRQFSLGSNPNHRKQNRVHNGNKAGRCDNLERDICKIVLQTASAGKKKAHFLVEDKRAKIKKTNENTAAAHETIEKDSSNDHVQYILSDLFKEVASNDMKTERVNRESGTHQDSEMLMKSRMKMENANEKARQISLFDAAERETDMEATFFTETIKEKAEQVSLFDAVEGETVIDSPVNTLHMKEKAEKISLFDAVLDEDDNDDAGDEYDDVIDARDDDGLHRLNTSHFVEPASATAQNVKALYFQNVKTIGKVEGEFKPKTERRTAMLRNLPSMNIIEESKVSSSYGFDGILRRLFCVFQTKPTGRNEAEEFSFDSRKVDGSKTNIYNSTSVNRSHDGGREKPRNDQTECTRNINEKDGDLGPETPSSSGEFASQWNQIGIALNSSFERSKSSKAKHGTFGHKSLQAPYDFAAAESSDQTMQRLLGKAKLNMKQNRNALSSKTVVSRKSTSNDEIAASEEARMMSDQGHGLIASFVSRPKKQSKSKKKKSPKQDNGAGPSSGKVIISCYDAKREKATISKIRWNPRRRGRKRAGRQSQ